MKGPYIYDVHTEVGWGILKFFTWLQISFSLSNRPIVHFRESRGGGAGVNKIGHFFERHKYMTSLSFSSQTNFSLKLEFIRSFKKQIRMSKVLCTEEATGGVL